LIEVSADIWIDRPELFAHVLLVLKIWLVERKKYILEDSIVMYIVCLLEKKA
jgi:hypothetical protein